MLVKAFFAGIAFGMLVLLSGCEKVSVPTEQQPDLSPLAEQYVTLVLALGEHDSSYVDAYYGPAEWAEQARENTKTAAQIVTEAQLLKQQVMAFAPTEQLIRLRQHYLDRQLTALISHAETLAKQQAGSFEQQAQALYDTVPPQRALSSFEPVLQQLAQRVPGEGDLAERVVAYRAQFVIPATQLQAVFERAISECKARSAAHIRLPEHENFTLEFVSDKPWSGYNWFKGNAYSLIQINTERPIDISRAVDLGCHEGYPGHHAYNALLEQKLSKERGWVEFSVYPLFSPQSLIAEGTANYGIEMAFPGAEKWQFERDVLYPLAGLDASKAEEYDHFLKLLAQLSYAGNEIARLYINGEIAAEQFVALQQQYLLQSEAEARQRLRFVETYGAYVINYNWGKDLVKNYIAEADSEHARWQRFTTLLSTPRLPSSIDW